MDLLPEATDDLYLRDRDAACASVVAMATLVKKPVDIIFVVDNSGSMTEEIQAIEKNINVNFAQIIGASGLDYRVILLSHHGSSILDQSICVGKPLSGNNTCTPPPPTPTNGPSFFHYSYEIASNDSFRPHPRQLQQARSDGQRADGLVGLAAARGGQGLHRDHRRQLRHDGGDLRADAAGEGADDVGTMASRNYVWHSIVGLRANTPPTQPWAPGDPLQNLLCGSDAVAAGVDYQNLSVLTGGLRFPICEFASFDAVFMTVAMGVIQGAQVACQFAVPAAPTGEKVDLSTVQLIYTPSDGTGARALLQVADATLCAPDSFYIDGDEIRLCAAPATW